MCQTNSWKSLYTTTGKDHVSITGRRSDGKIIGVSVKFCETDTTQIIAFKVKDLITELESLRNAKIGEFPPKPLIITTKQIEENKQK